MSIFNIHTMLLSENSLFGYKDPQPTIWVPEYIVVKFCNVSKGYLAKVRTLYKQAVGINYRVDSGLTSCFLDKINMSWRWGFNGHGYYYDIQAIPNKSPVFYRSRLPFESEIRGQIHAEENKVSRSDQKKVGGVVEMYFDYDDVCRFLDAGFKPVQARHLAKSAAWIKSIRRVIRFSLYECYGCYDQEDFLKYCTKELSRRRLFGLCVLNAEDLWDIVSGAPDREDELRQYLIRTGRG